MSCFRNVNAQCLRVHEEISLLLRRRSLSINADKWVDGYDHGSILVTPDYSSNKINGMESKKKRTQENEVYEAMDVTIK